MFGTCNKSTTVIRLTVERMQRQMARFVKSRYTVYKILFLICLMSWGGRPFLKGDMRFNTRAIVVCMNNVRRQIMWRVIYRSYERRSKCIIRSMTMALKGDIRV